jgi:hypothetical protein
MANDGGFPRAIRQFGVATLLCDSAPVHAFVEGCPHVKAVQPPKTPS